MSEYSREYFSTTMCEQCNVLLSTLLIFAIASLVLVLTKIATILMAVLSILLCQSQVATCQSN